MVEIVYWAVGVSWLLAQVIKVIYHSMRSRCFMPSQFVKTGGMPSGHSTLASALTTAVMIDQGIGPLFYVTFGFSMIVMHDAIAPRITRRHTPFQVASGIILGVGIVLLAYIVF